MIRTREVITSDETFLFETFISTNINKFLPLALSEERLIELLRMQYEAQKTSYQNRFPQALHEIVILQGLRVGRIMTGIENESLHLIDISLLPNFRGQGYGTQLLRELQSYAMNHKIPITLQVAQENPAKYLYEKCGFKMINNIIPYITMKWEPKL